jgi:thioesterase domain-containing protein
MDEEVSLLALLDSYPFEWTSRTNGHDKQSEREFPSAMTDEILRKMLDGLGHDGHTPSPLSAQEHQAVRNVCESNVRIISTFSPRRFEGDVLVFVAANSHAEPPVESWRPYVDGRIRMHEIDCVHDSLMDALPAAKIGKALAKELDRQRATKQSLILWRTK